MGARRLYKWKRRIAWTLGLLCSKTFEYESLMEGQIHGTLGMSLSQLSRIDIKGRFIVEGNDGTRATIPLKEANAWTRDGCKRCPDFAAQHADISFGGLGQTGRMTLVIVRTELGEQLWRDALAEGVVEQRPVLEETLALLSRLSVSQRERWGGPSGSAESNATG
jgi:coenzyme F420 hydrogenase subunit beta